MVPRVAVFIKRKKQAPDSMEHKYLTIFNAQFSQRGLMQRKLALNTGQKPFIEGTNYI